MTDVDYEALDHQGMAIELIDAFADLDAHALAVSDPAGRAEQLHARRVLYRHLDRIWEDAKLHGLHPTVRPDYSVVAGLRDLSNALVTQAQAAQRDATDDPHA